MMRGAASTARSLRYGYNWEAQGNEQPDRANGGTAVTQQTFDTPPPQKAQSAVTIDAEPPTPTPAPLEEITYEGTCMGQSCFQVPEGLNIGLCAKTNVYIHIDLAKRQKLCDYELTRYHPSHKQAAAKKPKKPQVKETKRKT